MTEKAFPRQRFDQEREFVVGRQFTFNGRGFVTGQFFDKSLVNKRRLRLLYEQRYVRMMDVAPSVEQPKPEGVAERRPRRSLRTA